MTGDGLWTCGAHQNLKGRDITEVWYLPAPGRSLTGICLLTGTWGSASNILRSKSVPCEWLMDSGSGVPPYTKVYAGEFCNQHLSVARQWSNLLLPTSMPLWHYKVGICSR